MIKPFMHTWKHGEQKLDSIHDDLQKLQGLLQLIRQAEDRHENLVRYANGYFGTAIPPERAKAFRDAACTMAAHDRLVKIFNYTLLEISL